MAVAWCEISSEHKRYNPLLRFIILSFLVHLGLLWWFKLPSMGSTDVKLTPILKIKLVDSRSRTDKQALEFESSHAPVEINLEEHSKQAMPGLLTPGSSMKNLPPTAVEKKDHDKPVNTNAVATDERPAEPLLSERALSAVRSSEFSVTDLKGDGITIFDPRVRHRLDAARLEAKRNAELQEKISMTSHVAVIGETEDHLELRINGQCWYVPRYEEDQPFSSNMWKRNMNCPDQTPNIQFSR